MKSFSEFITEARQSVKDYSTIDPEEQERIRRREAKMGRDPNWEEKSRQEARRKAKEELLRNRAKKTNVSGEDIRSGNKAQTQTPPPPPKGSQTPPKQSSGGSGAGAPPPPPPQNPQQSQSSPGPKRSSTSSSRPPRPYRNSGAGRTERVRNVTSQGKPPTTQTPQVAKPAGKWAKIGKIAGPASAALDTALSTADERAKGSGWARSLAKGATVAAGGLLGGTAGAIGGGGIGSAVTGTAGALAGAAAAEKAFDTVAGANARERKAMATANRQRQAGTAVKGIGGNTTFSQKKPGGPAFMSTGSGSQRKTVQLAKTGVVQRGGQSTAGHLAFKGGKAVYKAGPSAQSLAKTSSNPLERVGRTLFAGAYKKHDAAKAQQALQKARASDTARNKALGVKMQPGK